MQHMEISDTRSMIILVPLHKLPRRLIRAHLSFYCLLYLSCGRVSKQTELISSLSGGRCTPFLIQPCSDVHNTDLDYAITCVMPQPPQPKQTWSGSTGSRARQPADGASHGSMESDRFLCSGQVGTSYTPPFKGTIRVCVARPWQVGRHHHTV